MTTAPRKAVPSRTGKPAATKAVALPDRKITNVVGEDAARWASFLGSVETSDAARENVVTLFRQGVDMTDMDVSCVVAGAAVLDRSNVVGQAVAAALAGRAGRGGQAAYCRALPRGFDKDGTPIPLGKDTASKRALMGEMLLAGIVPDGIAPQKLMTAISKSSGTFRKQLLSTAKPENRRAKVLSEARRIERENKVAPTPTVPPAREGNPDAITTVIAALALIDAVTIAGASDGERASLRKALAGVAKRLETYEADKATAAA